MGQQVAIRSGAAGLARAGLSVALAGVAANALGYLAYMIGNRLLDRQEFGGYAALLNILAIGTVPMIGLQTAVAIRRARSPESAGASLWRTAWVTSATCGGTLALASPALAALLHVPVVEVLLLAAAIAPLTLAGLGLGLLQGAERFHALAVGFAAVGVGRYTGIIAGVAIGHSRVAGMIGCVVGCVLATLLVVWLAGRLPAEGPGMSLREVASAGNALLALITLSNVDLLLAQHVLPASESAAYGVGAILLKGAEWAPQAVVLVALPHLARGRSGTLSIALAAVVAAGTLLVGGAALFGDLAVRIAGGAQYTDLAPRAWLFGAAGAALAVVYLLVNDRLARHGSWLALPIWGAVALDAILITLWRPPSLSRTIALALAVAAGTAVVLLLQRWYAARARA